jgi:hypothetical protein
MQLTTNFTLEESIESQIARDHNIAEQFNPPAWVIANLTVLFRELIQKIRDALGPLHVSSGWRCAEVNRLAGGVPDSQHLTGEGADIEYYGPGGNQAIIDKVIELGLEFDQMIDEAHLAWVHLSYTLAHPNRRQKERMIDGKYFPM